MKEGSNYFLYFNQESHIEILATISSSRETWSRRQHKKFHKNHRITMPQFTHSQTT